MVTTLGAGVAQADEQFVGELDHVIVACAALVRVRPYFDTLAQGISERQ